MERYRAFGTVEYDDGKAKSFKGIKITYGNKTKKFNTGDPLIDWFDYHKFVYTGAASEEDIYSIGWSSSVDHWFMDTNDYFEKYLKEVGEEFEFMSDEDMKFMSFQDMDKTQKCVIHKDMKSVKDLIEYYKKHKKTNLK